MCVCEEPIIIGIQKGFLPFREKAKMSSIERQPLTKKVLFDKFNYRNAAASQDAATAAVRRRFLMLARDSVGGQKNKISLRVV